MEIITNAIIVILFIIPFISFIILINLIEIIIINFYLIQLSNIIYSQQK